MAFPMPELPPVTMATFPLERHGALPFLSISWPAGGSAARGSRLQGDVRRRPTERLHPIRGICDRAGSAMMAAVRAVDPRLLEVGPPDPDLPGHVGAAGRRPRGPADRPGLAAGHHRGRGLHRRRGPGRLAGPDGAPPGRHRRPGPGVVGCGGVGRPLLRPGEVDAAGGPGDTRRRPRARPAPPWPAPAIWPPSPPGASMPWTVTSPGICPSSCWR